MKHLFSAKMLLCSITFFFIRSALYGAEQTLNGRQEEQEVKTIHSSPSYKPSWNGTYYEYSLCGSIRDKVAEVLNAINPQFPLALLDMIQAYIAEETPPLEVEALQLLYDTRCNKPYMTLYTQKATDVIGIPFTTHSHLSSLRLAPEAKVTAPSLCTIRIDSPNTYQVSRISETGSLDTSCTRTYYPLPFSGVDEEHRSASRKTYPDLWAFAPYATYQMESEDEQSSDSQEKKRFLIMKYPNNNRYSKATGPIMATTSATHPPASNTPCLSRLCIVSPSFDEPFSFCRIEECSSPDDRRNYPEKHNILFFYRYAEDLLYKNYRYGKCVRAEDDPTPLNIAFNASRLLLLTSTKMINPPGRRDDCLYPPFDQRILFYRRQSAQGLKGLLDPLPSLALTTTHTLPSHSPYIFPQNMDPDKEPILISPAGIYRLKHTQSSAYKLTKLYTFPFSRAITEAIEHQTERDGKEQDDKRVFLQFAQYYYQIHSNCADRKITIAECYMNNNTQEVWAHIYITHNNKRSVEESGIFCFPLASTKIASFFPYSFFIQQIATVNESPERQKELLTQGFSFRKVNTGLFACLSPMSLCPSIPPVSQTAENNAPICLGTCIHQQDTGTTSPRPLPHASAPPENRTPEITQTAPTPHPLFIKPPIALGEGACPAFTLPIALLRACVQTQKNRSTPKPTIVSLVPLLTPNILKQPLEAFRPTHPMPDQRTNSMTNEDRLIHPEWDLRLPDKTPFLLPDNVDPRETIYLLSPQGVHRLESPPSSTRSSQTAASLTCVATFPLQNHNSSATRTFIRCTNMIYSLQRITDKYTFTFSNFLVDWDKKTAVVNVQVQYNNTLTYDMEQSGIIILPLTSSHNSSVRFLPYTTLSAFMSEQETKKRLEQLHGQQYSFNSLSHAVAPYLSPYTLRTAHNQQQPKTLVSLPPHPLIVKHYASAASASHVTRRATLMCTVAVGLCAIIAYRHRCSTNTNK